MLLVDREEASELSFLINCAVGTFVTDKQRLTSSSLSLSTTFFRARSKGIHPHGILALRLGVNIRVRKLVVSLASVITTYQKFHLAIFLLDASTKSGFETHVYECTE